MSITRSNIVYPPSGEWAIADNENPKLYRPNISKYGHEHRNNRKDSKLFYPENDLHPPLSQKEQDAFKVDVALNKSGSPIITHRGEPLDGFDFVGIILDNDTMFLAPREDDNSRKMTHQILARGGAVKHPFTAHLTEGRIKFSNDLSYESGHYKPNAGLVFLLFDKLHDFLDKELPHHLTEKRTIAARKAKEKSEKHDEDYSMLISTPRLKYNALF